MAVVAREDLEAGLDEIRRSPVGAGTVELIVRRPAEDDREVVAEATLDPEEGLLGDRWHLPRRDGRPPDPDAQVTLMNARAAALVAGPREAWPPAGDQLYVDLDLGVGSLPPGAQLQIGEAIVEITATPHTGCAKFSARFGSDALRFVNSPDGRALRLRGVNTRVVQGGVVRTGDAIRKL